MIKKATGIVLGTMMAWAAAQAAPTEHYIAADLDRATTKLGADAATTGSASETLARYPGHFTMVSYRSKGGSGELHRQFADAFNIARGGATLVTEGTLIVSKEERSIPVTIAKRRKTQ